MLVLTRRLGEKIMIDNGRVVVKVLGFHGKSVRLGMEADTDTRILRGELADALENKHTPSDEDDAQEG